MLKGVVGGGGTGGGGTGNVVGPASSTALAVALFADTTGKLLTGSSSGSGMLLDLAYTGPSGTKGAHPSFVLTNAGIGGSYNNTTTICPVWDFNYTVTPTGNQAGFASNTFLKFQNVTAGTFNISGQTGIDGVTFHASTGTNGYVTGYSSTFGATAAGTLTAAAGFTSILRATGGPTISTVIGFAHAGDGTAGLTGTIGSWRGFSTTEMDLTGTLTMTGDRAANYIGTMGGTPGGLDHAIYSLATQPSLLTGSLGVGTEPTTKLHVAQNSGLATFTNSAGTAIATVAAVASSITAATTSQALVGDIQVALGAGAASAFTLNGMSGLATIGSGDAATHNAATIMNGGSFTATYAGTGTGPILVGVNANATKTGSGAVSSLIASSAFVTVAASGGTVTAATAFTSGMSFAGSGALTVTTTKMLNLSRLTGDSDVTFTNIVMADIGNAAPAAAAAITNATIALRIQSQTGTGAIALQTLGTDDLIQFASPISTYNNVVTAGWGVPGINGYGRVAAATNTGTAAIATYTVGAADGSFEVSGNCQVTTSTTHSFSLDVVYTDETNTGRTMVLPVNQLGGAFLANGLITNVTGVGPYETAVCHIRCKAATSITVRTSAGGTFTGVVYNAEGTIKQTA